LQVAWKIVREHHGPCDGGYVEKLPGSFSEVLITHRSVRGAEIDRLGQDLFLSPAGAYGLIVKANGMVDFGIFVEPLGVKRVRESRARAIDKHLAMRQA